MINLFVVESPFQLLSAIEASEYFRGGENVFIIKYSSYRSHANSNQQMSILKSQLKVQRLYEIQPSFSTKFTNIKLFFLIKKVKNNYPFIDKLFIGEFRSWIHREFITFFKPNQCFVLDDGNAIIALQNDYIPFNKSYYFGNNNFSKFIDKAQHELFKLLFSPPLGRETVNVNLFTCFDLVPYSSKQLIINHSFEHLKKRSGNKSVLKNVVYFFGGNLTEIGILTQEHEVDELGKVKYFFENQNLKMIYISHRRDSKVKLDLIENELNIEILHFTYPAELEFVFMDKIPEYIASFFSTALYTVSKIVPFKNVYSFRLEKEILNINFIREIENTYSNYVNDQLISVISVND